MLHRSFKPAKCKTSLKLSVSRIKLLKNKKASQVLHLKRELAKLLESGQDQTARIRVEHLVREEKTIAAYDLIEIYCELIAARLPIIESQKNCPIDLKEAITSVIFASPRCSDIPELLDVRKQFTAKYGKEFISSVVELRPECGVNRSMVEKLSAIAPDGKTKIKILNAIAEEHNIQWVPTSFGEKQPTTPEDLLNGPNTLEKSSKMHADTLPAQDQKHVVPADLNTQNARSSASIQHDGSAEHDSNRMKSPSNFHRFRSGVGSEELECSRESFGERNEFYVDSKDWNMEFKDATSAAQAAAESAERASMAARAAAELSNQERIVRQYSRESQKSSFHDLQDARPRNSVASKLSAEHRLKDPSNSFSHCNNPRIYNEKANEDQNDNMGGVVQASSRDDGNTKRYSGVASFKSNATSTDEDLSLHNFQKEVRYPPRNDFEGEYMKFEKGNFFEVSRKEQADKFVGSNFTHDLSEDLSNSFSDGKNPWIHTEKTNGKEKDNMGRAAEASPRNDGNTNGYSGTASFKSYEVSIEEDLLANSFQNAGRYPHTNDFEVESMKPDKVNSFDEEVRKEQASDFEVRLQDGLETDNFNYIAESRCTKQSSTVSTSGNVDGESSNYQGHANGDRYKGFFVDVHQTDFQAKTEPSNSYDNAAAVFDDSASDEDEHRFNLGHDHIEQNSVNPKAWSLTRDENELAFSHFTTESYHISQLPESRNMPSVTIESEDITAVTFDESNGPSSESEVEVEKPKLTERMDEKRLISQQTTDAARSSDSSLSWSHQGVAASSFKETEHTVSVDNISHSDSLSSRPLNRHPKPQLEYTDEVKRPETLQKSRFSFTGGLEDNAAHPEMSRDAAQDIEISDGERKYLNLGTLMGGRRNKGYKHPPYVNNPSNKSSSSQLMFKDDLISSADSTTPEVTIQEPIDKETRSKVNTKDTSRAPVSYLNSTDSSDEEFPRKPSSRYLEPSKQKVGMKEDKKISGGRAAPITYFDSDSDDSEYNLGPSSANKNRSGSGISRRTKVSPPDSQRSSHPNVRAEDEVSITPDYGSERKASSRKSMATETSSSHRGSSKPILKSKFSMHTEGSKAPGKEQTSSRETPLKEGSTKASHVHPKLPDFDTISAQLASLRLNRKY